MTKAPILAVTLMCLAMADADARSPTDPDLPLLRAAAERGDVAEVRRIVSAGTPVDLKDEAGRTALLLATGNGHTEVARVLIEAGADINAQAANMDTPWMLAGARGRHEILALMLPKGPNYALRNRFGGNALIPACERAHVETVRLLLAKSRIPVDHINNLGWTCLLEIVILGDGGPRHVEVARLVLDAGANPNIADKDGVTPLQHARRRGQAEIARLIVATGGR
jgi:hypothetical protein